LWQAVNDGKAAKAGPSATRDWINSLRFIDLKCVKMVKMVDLKMVIT
jgi:hypothetical protein